jgi:hypothetical protein
VGKPTHYAFEMEDVDRLVLRAVHEGGISMLSQAEQAAFAAFLKEQVVLRVAAAEKKK